MTVVDLADGEILTVTADKGGYGTVWREGGPAPGQWNVGALAPLNFGRPGVYRIETVRGNVTHTIEGRDTAALVQALPRHTETIQSARVIASALVEGQQAIAELKRSRPVSMHEKFKLLAERARTVPAALSDRADKAFARLGTLESRGGVALSGMETVMDDLEAGISVSEDAVNQLTNGGGAQADPN